MHKYQRERPVTTRHNPADTAKPGGARRARSGCCVEDKCSSAPYGDNRCSRTALAAMDTHNPCTAPARRAASCARAPQCAIYMLLLDRGSEPSSDDVHTCHCQSACGLSVRRCQLASLLPSRAAIRASVHNHMQFPLCWQLLHLPQPNASQQGVWLDTPCRLKHHERATARLADPTANRLRQNHTCLSTQ